jgi:hypothetical protein
MNEYACFPTSGACENEQRTVPIVDGFELSRVQCHDEGLAMLPQSVATGKASTP